MLKQSEMLRNLSQVLKGTLIIGVTVKQKKPTPAGTPALQEGLLQADRSMHRCS